MVGEDADLLLPPEIWTTILIILPIESILLCKAVCKSWYSLISCPNFISLYSTKNLNKTGNRVLLNLDGDTDYFGSFISDNQSFVDYIDHYDDFPEPLIDQLQIVGSCNGLICLSKSDSTIYKHDNGMLEKDSAVVTFFIWNPVIRKVIEVPPMSFCPRARIISCFAFGFDSKTLDYKIMCVLDGNIHLGRTPGDYAHPSSREAVGVCEVFDLRKGAWRRNSPVFHSWSIRGHPDSSCYLDGVVHWAGYIGWESNWFVLSFDMSDEVFGEIRMPGFDSGWIDIKCVACGGLIYLLLWPWSEDISESFSLWVMKEYGVTDSWTKVSDISLQRPQGFPSGHLSSHKCLLWENGELLMLNYLEPGEDDVDFVTSGAI